MYKVKQINQFYLNIVKNWDSRDKSAVVETLKASLADVIFS